MKTIKDIAIIALITAFAASLFTGLRLMKEDSVPYYDTITWVDTIPYYKPIPKDSLVIRYITEKLPSADETDDEYATDSIYTDSSSVIIPITQKKYTDDSTYIAYVSGYKPSLDSILILLSRETVVTTTPCPIVQEKRWSVGVHVGYGITMSTMPQFAPYIGIGLSYKLFNF